MEGVPNWPWIDLRNDEIDEDWKLAQKGEQIKKIPPLEY
jgi:hypothetical protein